MKRLWFSVLLLAIIFAASLWNVSYLGRITTTVAALLSDAEVLAESDDWSGAEALTNEAKTLWESRESYLYTTLIHSDTDDVYVGFREVLELIYCQEGGEYSAANARLISKLELLHKMDQLTIRNIL